MPLRIGNLNKRISLQHLVALSPNQYASGEPSDAWVDFVEGGLYASVEPIAAGSAKESIVADQLQFSSSVRVTIRYLAGVDNAMRVLFKSKIYNIGEVVDPFESNEYLQLMCTEGVNDG